MIGSILAILSLGAVVLSRRQRLVPFVVPVGIMVVVSFGYGTLDGELIGQRVAPLFGLSVMTLTSGYLLASRYARRLERPTTEVADWQVNALWTLTLLFVGLTAIHFFRVGIPVFADNVETARYNLTGSGLFGLPSRAYLFGLPLTAAGAIYLYHRRRDAVCLQLVWTAVGALVLSRLLGGFRSGVLEAVIIVFVALSLSTGPLRVPEVIRRFALPMMGVVLVAVTLSGLYATLERRGSSPVDALVERATREAALPGWLALQDNSAIGLGSNGELTEDVRYYFHQYVDGTPGPYATYGQRVAAAIYGIPVYEANDVAPVTVGIFPQLRSQFGRLALMLMGFLGAAYAVTESLARRASVRGYVAGVGVILLLNDVITKGDPIYGLVNWGAVTLATVVVIDLFRVWGGGREVVVGLRNTET